MRSLCPRLCPDGLGLMAQCLHYLGRRRICARDAMRHAYFDALGPEIHGISDATSIFEVPGVALERDPGIRSGQTSHGECVLGFPPWGEDCERSSSSAGNRRRQSTLY